MVVLSASQPIVRSNEKEKKQAVQRRDSIDVPMLITKDVVMTECVFCAMDCTISDSLQCEYCSERYHLACCCVQSEIKKRSSHL